MAIVGNVECYVEKCHGNVPATTGASEYIAPFSTCNDEIIIAYDTDVNLEPFLVIREEVLKHRVTI